MKFTKMQGCGNDYVYIDCFKEKVEKRIRRGINDIEPIYYEITSLLVSKATEQLNTQFYGEIFLAISCLL